MGKKKLTEGEDLAVRKFCLEQAVRSFSSGLSVDDPPKKSEEAILDEARKYYGFVTYWPDDEVPAEYEEAAEE